MRASLPTVLPAVELVVFDDAAEMVSWLKQHISDVLLFSLDHDLPLRNQDGMTHDCGTGRQVADYLATEVPTCPVIIHSSNDPCARGMLQTLQDGGWPCRRVYPRDDIAWIGGDWLAAIHRLQMDGWFPHRI
jgi:hypothetical protein